MKKIVLLIASVMLLGSAFAQGDAITTIFSKYENNELFTKVNITSKMFSLVNELDAEDENDKEFLEAISKLEGLKILTADSIGNAMQIYQDAIAKVKGGNYEELMSVRDGDENMQFMIKEKGKTINELLMLVGGEKKFFILSLYGEIDLKQISKLSRTMNVKGMEKLGELGKDKEDKE